jgi:hypothetical protein
MKKGWRNDPLWVELYERRERERLERRIERVRLGHEIQRSQEEAERFIRQVERGTFWKIA